MLDQAKRITASTENHRKPNETNNNNSKYLYKKLVNVGSPGSALGMNSEEINAEIMCGFP